MKINLSTMRELIIFSLPIIIGQLGQMFIGVGDSLIASWHSVEYIGIVGISLGIISPLFVVALGLCAGISPLLSQKRGNNESIDKYLSSSIFMSAAIGCFFTLLAFIVSFIIPFLGFDPLVTPKIKEYFLIFSLSFPAAMIFIGIKEFLQAKEDIMYANSMSIVAVFLNLLLGYALTFGKFGIPEYGLNGLAFAAIIVRLFLALSLIFYVKKYLFQEYFLDWQFIKEAIKLGFPISLTILAEVSAFTTLTIIIGRVSIEQAGAHNIVLHMASVTFMVPLAICTALAVKVGNAYGQKNFLLMKNYLSCGLLMSWIFMSFTCLLFLTIPETLLSIFTTDAGLLLIAAKLLLVVGLFQLFDGTQVTVAGILRGVGETKKPFWIVFLSYWIIGIPIGLLLRTWIELDAFALWIGIALALFCAALSLLLVLYKTFKRIKLSIS